MKRFLFSIAAVSLVGSTLMASPKVTLKQIGKNAVVEYKGLDKTHKYAFSIKKAGSRWGDFIKPVGHTGSPTQYRGRFFIAPLAKLTNGATYKLYIYDYKLKKNVATSNSIVVRTKIPSSYTAPRPKAYTVRTSNNGLMLRYSGFTNKNKDYRIELLKECHKSWYWQAGYLNPNKGGLSDSGYFYFGTVPSDYYSARVKDMSAGGKVIFVSSCIRAGNKKSPLISQIAKHFKKDKGKSRVAQLRRAREAKAKMAKRRAVRAARIRARR